MALAVCCVVGFVFLLDALIGAISLLWAALAAGAIAAAAVYLTRDKPDDEHDRIRCASCRRVAKRGLFCAFCGTQLEGPRALEDLRITIVGGGTSVLVPYGARLPATGAETFTTAAADQSSVDIHLVTSGRALGRERQRTLERLTFPLEPCTGTAEVRITAKVDVDGALDLEIKQLGTEHEMRRGGIAVAVAGRDTKPSTAETTAN